MNEIRIIRLERMFAGLLGYDINNVPLLQNVYGNQCEVPTVAKKKKEADVGSDSVILISFGNISIFT